MKKLLALGAASLVCLSFPAMAEESAPVVGEKPAMHGGIIFDADTNKDGLLSKDEFMALQEKRWSEMDVNKDGNVTKEEMKAQKEAFRKKMQEMRAKRDAERGEEGLGSKHEKPQQ